MIRATNLTFLHCGHRRPAVELRIASDERGAIIPLIAGIIVGVIVIVAILTDHSREEISLQQIQSVADAAALAGARRLDWTEEGWVNAKRAAVASIQNSTLYGADQSFRDGLVLLEGDIEDPDANPAPDDKKETDARYLGNQGNIGNVTFKIERGSWIRNTTYDSSDPESKEYTFDPLDSKPWTALAYSNATAVRVTATLASLPTIFGKTLKINITGFNNLTRASTAINDGAFEKCVAPIAIPKCSLFLNMAREIEGNHFYTPMDGEGYKPREQCTREVVAAEANPEHFKRRGGIARSESYPRPPYFFEDWPAEIALNDHAFPIRAVLGVPSADDDSPASPADVANALKTLGSSAPNCPNGGVVAGPQWKFRPLDSIYDNAGMKRSGVDALYDEPTLEIALGNAISNGSMEFKKAFGQPPTEANPAPADPVKPNFPYLRRYRPNNPENPNVELEMNWQMTYNREGSIYLADMGEATNWVNPMCHSPAVRNGNDIANARVAKVRVMLLESSDPDRPNMYCDFENLFTGDRQESVPPTSDTGPRVAGFINAYIFDFNFRDLENPANHNGSATTPFYANINAAGESVRDQNPLSARPRRANYRMQGVNSGKQKDYIRKLRRWYKDRANDCFIPWIDSSTPTGCSCIDAPLPTLDQSVWESECLLACEGREGIGNCSTPLSDSESEHCLEDARAKAIKELTTATCGESCEAISCPSAGPKPVPPTGIPPVIEDDRDEDDVDQCLDACLAANPDPAFDPNTCGCEPPDAGSYWYKECFHELQRFVGNTEVGYLSSRNPGYVHPLLHTQYKEKFWDDPERFYNELAFISKVLDDVRPDPDFEIPIPDPTTIGNPGVLSDWLTNIENAALGGGTTFSTYRTRFNSWSDIVTDYNPATKYYNRLQARPWTAKMNSELILDLATMLGEEYPWYGIPETEIQESEANPVVPGTPVAPAVLTTARKNAMNDILNKITSVDIPTIPNTSIGDLLAKYKQPSIPGKHCLPLKKDNKFPTDDDDSWYQPSDWKAGYGCGGVRLRLDCETSNFSGSDSLDTIEPALIE